MLKYERRNRALAGVSVLLLLLQMFAGVSPQTASAAAPDSVKDTLTRHKVSTLSSHTIAVNTATGTQWIAGETLTIDFGEDDSMFTVAGATTVATDFDITDGTTTYVPIATCDVTADDVEFAVNDTTGVVTLTMCTGSTSTTSGATITINYGSTATTGGAGADRVTNSATVGSKEIVIGGTYGDDSAELDVPIMDDDQVTVTASVDTFITFDIDVSNGHGDSDAAYAIDLQELTFGSYNDENTSGVNEIYVDLDTNAASGVAVDVKNANGSNGLSSSSTSDNIPSATGALTTGTNDGRYGIAASSLSGLTVVAPYTQDAGNVGVLSSTFAGLFTVDGPVAAASGQVNVRAISGVLSAAADDYTDTLTFRATATF